MDVAATGTEGRPTIALDVEPRLLRDALERLLAEREVTVVPTGEAEHGAVDIAVTSGEAAAVRPADLVLRLLGAPSRRTPDVAGRVIVDVDRLEVLLDEIDRWEPGRSAR